jgi:NAD+-dependent protein deacetylase SIR2
MGTSLTVHPFASLTRIVPDSCPRILINMDQAGDIGTRADDVLLLGKTDEVIRELCEELGPDWVEELDAMWKETEKYARKEGEGEAAEGVKKDTKVTAEDERAQEKAVVDEVEKLTAEIGKSLRIEEVPKDDATEKSSATKSEVPSKGPITDVQVEEAIGFVEASAKPDLAEAANQPTTKEDSEVDDKKEDKIVEGKL